MNTDTFIKDLERMFAVTPADVKNTTADFHSEMKLGLSGKKSSLKMLPSFVVRPRGTEKGRYLALDLGGTNLRFLAVELDGHGKAVVLAVDRFVIEKNLMCGEGPALFDFIAQCVIDFLRKAGISADGGLDLGFTFSFPVEQTGIAAGRLIAWTKGFSASGVVGEDVVALLTRALARKGMASVKISALVNDTVGTLVAKSYSDRSCDMGVILGTGTIACYPESIANITKDRGLGVGGEMIINMEWGNFARLTRTRYDIEVDKASQNAGFHFLEKMVSGMYLGELTRRIVADLGRLGLCNAFLKEYSFKTEYMSLLAAGNFGIPAEFGLNNASADDRGALKSICKIVSLRSARLSGMAIAAVVTWMDPKLEREYTIGIDGSLFEGYPGFKDNIVGVFTDLFGVRASRIRLEMAKDGSGIGAAITAAVASGR